MSCEDEHFRGHSHSHTHGGDSDDDHSHVMPIETSGAQSLWSKINHPHVVALNMRNSSEDIQKIFKKHEDRYQAKPIIKSDCDSQLIIHIPFINASVKLHSIILRTNGENYCPKTIRLWKNDPSIDFDLAVAKKANYTIEHPKVGLSDYKTDDDCEEEIKSENEFVEHHVPRHIFSGVTHLTIFIEDIYGDEEESWIHNIELRGESAELTKDPVITLYESAANPADHKNMVADESSAFTQL